MNTGHATTTAGNIELMREVICRATRLMHSSDYGHLFPEKYIADWGKRQLFWIGDAVQKRWKGDPEALSEALKRLKPSQNVMDRAFLFFIRRFSRGNAVITRLYLGYLSFTWPATLLMLRWILRNALCPLSKRKSMSLPQETKVP
jgi:hypothetical protein